MSQFVVYIAVSLDGYIADAGGGVGWLDSFECDEYGYERFLESLGTIIVGRVTYDQIVSFGAWPYGEIQTLVWSGGNVEDLPGSALSWSENLENTVKWLTERADGKDVWVLGGAKTIKAFNDAGMIDRMEIFVMPVLLGSGVRLFEEEGSEPQILKLENAQPYVNGVVKLTYTMR